MRSIPACAGETPKPSFFIVSIRVYPRVCGGNLGRNENRTTGGGLSPRVRGKRLRRQTSNWAKWSIPACAGETVSAAAVSGVTWVYPRVCGGNHRARPALGRRPDGLSPRVRGKPSTAAAAAYCARSIPACAGETNDERNPRGRCAVYPRVCGGNRGFAIRRPGEKGLSPRVRGKLYLT